MQDAPETHIYNSLPLTLFRTNTQTHTARTSFFNPRERKIHTRQLKKKATNWDNFEVWICTYACWCFNGTLKSVTETWGRSVFIKLIITRMERGRENPLSGRPIHLNVNICPCMLPKNHNQETFQRRHWLQTSTATISAKRCSCSKKYQIEPSAVLGKPCPSWKHPSTPTAVW